MVSIIAEENYKIIRNFEDYCYLYPISNFSFETK